MSEISEKFKTLRVKFFYGGLFDLETNERLPYKNTYAICYEGPAWITIYENKVIRILTDNGLSCSG